jgi:predicted DCC family thiol-disulfide oxidoreductase YuxK
MRRIEGFFFAPATPVNLGVLRIGLFATTAICAAGEDVRADAAAAAINWRPTSFFRLLGAPPPAGALRAVQVVLIASAILAAAGIWSRASQWIATPAAAFLLGFDSNFGKINHRSMLLVLLLLAILPARTSDGVSLDRLIDAARRRTAEPVAPHARYRWPVALAQVTAVSVYFFAGVSKLVNGGPAWFSAAAFRRFLYVRLDQLADPPRAGLWLASHPALAQAAAVGSVVFELSVALVLLRPVLKRIVLPGLVAFHEATRALTRIDFTRTLAVAWMPLVDFEAVGARIRGRMRRAPDAVFFDGACGLCRRSAAVLGAADALGRLEFVDARDAGALAGRFPQLDPEALLKEMHIVTSSGGVAAGFYAFRRLAAVLPLGWIALPFLYVPGVPAAGRAVYRRIADSRLPVLHCAGGACELDARAAPVRPGNL